MEAFFVVLLAVTMVGVGLVAGLALRRLTTRTHPAKTPEPDDQER